MKKQKMNRTAKLSFYLKRTKKGDGVRLSKKTGYSVSHISNVKAYRRSVPTDLANAMYQISKKREKQF